MTSRYMGRQHEEEQDGVVVVEGHPSSVDVHMHSHDHNDDYSDGSEELDDDPNVHAVYNTSNNDLSHSSMSSSDLNNNSSNAKRRRSTFHNGGLLGRRETRQIGWLRIIVFSALLLATCVVSIVIYVSVRSSEREEFEAQTSNHALAILDALVLHFHSSLLALDNLALTALSGTALSRDPTIDPTNAMQVWPNVSIAEFVQRSGSIMNWGQLGGLLFVPKVSLEQRLGYEQYVQDTAQSWLPEALEYYNITTFPSVVPPRIHDKYDDQLGVPELDESAPFFPVWQSVPPIPPAVNQNFRSYDPTLAVEGQLMRAVKTIDQNVNVPSSDLARAVLTPLLNADTLKEVNADLALNTTVPASGILFPLVLQKQTVGFLWGNIAWDLFLQTTNLVNTAVAMQIVLTNPCGSGYSNSAILTGPEQPASYTFKVNQDLRVVFEGIGDLHDSKFNHLRKSLDLSETTLPKDQRKSSDIRFDDDLYLYTGVQFNRTYCPFQIEVYPSRQVEQEFFTAKPAIYTVLVIIVFVVTSLVFLGYDSLVERRQKKVMKSATKSHQIVSSLFPKNVRDRLFRDEEDDKSKHNDNEDAPAMGPFVSQKAKIKGYINTQQQEQQVPAVDDNKPKGRVRFGFGQNKHHPVETTTTSTTLIKSKPIADLFPNTTVMFADIAGFTAWSSSREPSQVFALLETVYGAFDHIAEKRRVFKVETIGDCYVAVTGLPDPQVDHAIIMAKYAGEILVRMRQVTNQLEVELGPDTADLGLRIGLHSGPVTAGVLRGQKSRFQLFGDTVNTASRMESHGRANQIQCSQSTADLLIEAGKKGWVKPRADLIHAKGKGAVQAYWVYPKGIQAAMALSAASASSNVGDGSSQASFGDLSADQLEIDRFPSSSPADDGGMSPNIKRMVDWNVDLLSRTLRKIVAKRLSLKQSKTQLLLNKVNPVTLATNAMQLAVQPITASLAGTGKDVVSDEFDLTMENPRDMYSEAIHLPQFDKRSIQLVHPDDIILKQDVQEQLRDYITKIAQSYHDNPFHNFDHASHVTMSANKILSRIVAADDMVTESKINSRTGVGQVAAKLHNYTYGITSDPLTHFACVFSALVHDVDHPGVPNSQLIKEKNEMAILYDNKSVAEQNSVDLAWGLLMDPAYAALRKCLFANQDDDKKRFHQLLVNSVMATDIFDPILKGVRDRRWDKAFSPSLPNSSGGSIASLSPSDSSDLKATVVIEHIIQAADVSHTMQHWHVYQKWNRRLFEEMYSAYKTGRVSMDPSVGWYSGELWFYDNYIIPLARKLSECGVFGVSSDEFLNYALDNRSEWESKGEALVAEMVQSFQ